MTAYHLVLGALLALMGLALLAWPRRAWLYTRG